MSRPVFFALLLSAFVTACGGGDPDDVSASVQSAAAAAERQQVTAQATALAPKAEFIGFTVTGGAKFRLTFSAGDFAGGAKVGDTIYLKHSFFSVYDGNTPKGKVQQVGDQLVAEVEVFYTHDSHAMFGVASSGYAPNFVNGLPSRPMLAPDKWQLPAAIAPFKQDDRWYLIINLHLL